MQHAQTAGVCVECASKASAGEHAYVVRLLVQRWQMSFLSAVQLSRQH